MLPKLLNAVIVSLSVAASAALAADRADEYLPFTRLTDNYEVGHRKQNYDEYKFPTSISKNIRVEGDKTIIEYSYKRSEVNASRLQFQRYFEALVKKSGGEIVHSGQTDEYRYAVSFKFPRNGKLAWGLVSTTNDNEIYHYRQVFVETNEPWGNATSVPSSPVAPLTAAVVPAPAPAPKAEPITPSKAATVVTVTEAEPPWNGGDWKEVNRGGCDVPDVRRSKVAVPDSDFCDAKMNGKVVICNADLGGCFYKNVTPKQCKEGRLQGRMYVCVGK